MRYLLFGLMMFTSGCATLNTAGRDFDSTGSICADGILVNIDYHGCKKLHTRQVPGTSTLKVHCEKRKEINNWTTNTFYFVPTYDYFSKPEAHTLCADPLIDAFFVDPYMMDQYAYPPVDPEPEVVPETETETTPETESDTDPEPEDDQ